MNWTNKVRRALLSLSLSLSSWHTLLERSRVRSRTPVSPRGCLLPRVGRTDVQSSQIRFNGSEPRVVGSSWRSFANCSSNWTAMVFTRSTDLCFHSSLHSHWFLFSRFSRLFYDLYISSDAKLFNRILTCPNHILRTLLPPPTARNYSLRNRPHNRQLPDRISPITDCNSTVRMLYRNMY